ncbi:MAG: M48 family metallopeptidase [Saprospiraceae bacterium]
MNTKNYLLVLFIGLLSFNLSAQDFENYIPTRAEAPLPADLLSSSTQKYLDSQSGAERQKKRADRKAQDKFFLQTNFALDELLSSGKLLFNDPMTKYVQGVVDNLLKNDAKLREKIKLYVIRSASVNAFATDRGEIFVNVGLLAKVKNEAELAFILCHELQHFVERHNLNSFIEFSRIERTRRDFRRDKNYEKLVAKHSYSKTLEKEADEKGLELFLTSGYKMKAAEGVFDLLELAHGTYANEKFEVSFFENDYVQFPAIYQKSAVKPVRPYEADSEEDKLSTHPSVDERREAFNEEFASRNLKNEGKEFIQPKAAFDKVQKMARFDLCDILISYRSYPAALYHGYLILKEYPNNSYAEKTIAKALYGIAQYTNKETYSDITISSEKIQGEMQAVFYLFEEMSKKEINTLASRYCWKTHKKYPDDKGIKRMAQDMIEDVVIFTIEKPDTYFKKDKKMTADAIEKEQTFAPYAFADIISDSTFTKWIENGKTYRKRRADSEEEQEEMGYYARSRENRKAAKKKRKKGAALNRKDVVFVNPFYLKGNAKKREPIQLIESEERQNKFKGWIEELGSDIGLKTTVLDVKHLNKRTTIEEYNNIIAINRWVDELLTNDMYMISSNYNDVLPIVKEYNSTTFAYTGALTFRKQKYLIENYYHLLYTVIPWTTPYGLDNLFRGSYESIYFSYVFDFENNRVLHREVNYMKQKDRDAIIKSNLYWLMHQIKQKPAKKKK